ncbi:MAG: hypothetical protein HYV78_00510 [Candidatus Wildermuthbacteria bacterium]|nr:hypothetical protein [Candidatus Wildermuthbacteria bacterium]
MNNGRRYPFIIRKQAVLLRKNGWTHREIAKKFKCSIGITYIWAWKIKLTKSQQQSIQSRKIKTLSTPEFKRQQSERARVTLAPYWKIKFTDKQLLQKIKNFYLLYQRIPLKREFGGKSWIYQMRFGSWNRAIQLAGFEPNKVIYSKKIKANDNHMCDSFAEKIIDDWLYSKKIEHQRNVVYQNTKMTADFGIGNIRVEYFGLAGQNSLYDKIMENKRSICKKQKLILLEIFPTDLFSKNFKKCLNRILSVVKNSQNLVY